MSGPPLSEEIWCLSGTGSLVWSNTSEWLGQAHSCCFSSSQRCWTGCTQSNPSTSHREKCLCLDLALCKGKGIIDSWCNNENTLNAPLLYVHVQVLLAVLYCIYLKQVCRNRSINQWQSRTNLLLIAFLHIFVFLSLSYYKFNYVTVNRSNGKILKSRISLGLVHMQTTHINISEDLLWEGETSCHLCRWSL